MINKKLKKENGFAVSDGLIAVLIITLFTGLIATLIYNIYLSNSSVKRMGTATGYITNIFEYIDKSYYDDITISGLETYINNNKSFFSIEDENKVNQINILSNDSEEEKKQIGTTNNPQYTININIEYYNKMENNTEKIDLVKEITVTAKYKLRNKDQEIQMKRIKSREKLITPNIPDLSLLQIENESKKIYPIKKSDNNWKICDEKDSEWYNYENGYWATVIVSENDLQKDQEINIDDYEKHVWIPRFAYDLTNNSILFLYSNTNKYINDIVNYNQLADLSDGQDVLVEFTDTIGIWINVSETINSEAYIKLNSVYERQE